MIKSNNGQSSKASARKYIKITNIHMRKINNILYMKRNRNASVHCDEFSNNFALIHFFPPHVAALFRVRETTVSHSVYLFWLNVTQSQKN